VSRTVLRAIATRALELVAVAVLISVLVLLLVRLVPGDPATTILGVHANPDALAALRAQLGLDRSLLAQIGESLGNLATGDLGTSLVFQQPVVDLVMPALAVTLSIVGLATVIAVVAGVPLGLLAALTSSSRVELAVRLSNATLLATPPVVAGILLLLVVAIHLGAAPAGGWAGAWPGNFEFAWLPSLTLSLFLIPYVARTVARAADDAQRQPYVEAAITRGISPRAVALRHVLPNSLIPVVTLIGLNASILIGGAVVIEAIYGLPGLGGVLTNAVSSRDFPVLQGAAIVTAVVVVLINMVSDVLYGVIDPRIRIARH
jgi:peptide/nickel transport system permease protein